MVTPVTRGLRAVVIILALVAVSCLLVLAVGAVVEVRSGVTVAPDRVDREETMAWIARALLFLAGLWILIGSIAARTRLVRRPGAAAARATWLASTRPWRSRESMLGLLPLDRALMVFVPLALLIGTRAVQTSFLIVWPTALMSSIWVTFVVVAALLVRPRSPWPVIAAVGGVVVMLCIVDLVGVAIAGPGAYGVALWSIPFVRFAAFTAGFALVAWAVAAAGGALNSQVGARRATGIVVAAVGITVFVICLFIALVGPAAFGEQWQDTILRVRLDPRLIWLPVIGGAAATVIGLLLVRFRR